MLPMGPCSSSNNPPYGPQWKDRDIGNCHQDYLTRNFATGNPYDPIHPQNKLNYCSMNKTLTLYVVSNFDLEKGSHVNVLSQLYFQSQAFLNVQPSDRCDLAWKLEGLNEATI